MMKKTLLALAASLAFVGVSQADDTTVTYVNAEVIAACELEQPEDVNYSTGFAYNQTSIQIYSLDMYIDCNENLPYQLSLDNADGVIVLTDGEKEMIAVVRHRHDETILGIDGNFDGVGTGTSDYLPLTLDVNPDIAANPWSGMFPEQGTYQGVAQFTITY